MPSVSPDILISYKRGDPDEAMAEALEKRLGMIGFRVWRDRSSMRPGADVDESIDTAVRQARAVVGILSERSLRSEHVKDEWAQSRDRLFLLRLDQASVPTRHQRRHATDSIDELVRELQRQVGAGGHCGVCLLWKHGALEMSSVRQREEHRILPKALAGACPLQEFEGLPALPEEPIIHPFEVRTPDSDRIGDAMGKLLGLEEMPAGLRLSLQTSLLAFPWLAMRIDGRRVCDSVEIDLELSNAEPLRGEERRGPISLNRRMWVSLWPPDVDRTWTLLSSADALDQQLVECRDFPTHPDNAERKSLVVIDLAGASPQFVGLAEELALAYRPICIFLRCSFDDLRRPVVQQIAYRGVTLCHIPHKQDIDILSGLIEPLLENGVEGLHEAIQTLRARHPHRPWLWPTIYAHRGDDGAR